MSEDYLIAIDKTLKRIADALEKFVENYELKQVLINSQTGEKTVVTEEVELDLTNVTYLRETEKAVLFHKNGYDVWIPKKAVDGGYISNGTLQDIKTYKWFTPTWKEGHL